MTAGTCWRTARQRRYRVEVRRGDSRVRAALDEGGVDSRRRFSETVGGDILLVTVPVVDEGEVIGMVRISASRETIVDGVHGSWLRLASIGLAVVAGAFVLAWILATTVSRPLGRLHDTEGELGGGDLDAHAPTDGPAELAALGVSFNRIADALGSSMRARHDLVANTSHQLRTPLTGIELRLEAIQVEGGGPARTRRKRRMSSTARGLVDDLLALAGAATPPPAGITVNLTSVAEDAVKRWQAPRRTKKTVAAGRLEQAMVFADPADLAHVVDNLIENALRTRRRAHRSPSRRLPRTGRGHSSSPTTGPGSPRRSARGSSSVTTGGRTGAVSAREPGRARDRRRARGALDGQVTLADGPARACG